MPRAVRAISPAFVRLIGSVTIVAVLYFAREILVPLALALLLTFLLSPAVTRLQQWHLSRVPAVILSVFLTVLVIGGVAWTVTVQLVDVANELPNYRSNIRAKIDAVRSPHGGVLGEASKSVDRLQKEFTELSGRPALPVRPQPAGRERPRQPMPVEVVEQPPSGLRYLREFLGPILGPLSTAGIVLIFTIFMLIEREALRNRLLRLVGQGRLHTMTQAFGDAGDRIGRYLQMQVVINAAFGTLFATGLWLLGLPNALLWGVLAGVFRFVPYVGTLGAAIFPLTLSLAVFDGWTRPLLTFGLFLVLELLTANVVEPWLYGAHTGVSSLAILVAAVFWTALWGPVGLLLSMPLTVCLVVLGRYLPQLEFLHVMLGDDPVLAPEAHLYQRLLAMDEQESHHVVETFLKQHSLSELYDDVIVPALSLAEQDRHRGSLEDERERYVEQSLFEMIAELGEQDQVARHPLPASGSRPRVLCFPAHDPADEITAAMLAQLLEREGCITLVFPVGPAASEVIRGMAQYSADLVCISSVPPFALSHARALCKRLRAEFPDLKILVGIWGSSTDSEQLSTRLGAHYADAVVNRLAHAVERVRELAPAEPVAAGSRPAAEVRQLS